MIHNVNKCLSSLESQLIFLTREEESALGFLIKYGFEEVRKGAINKLVYHNLRIVEYIAKRRFSNSGIDYDELESDGVVGLYDAAEKFDYTKRYRFSSYAVKKIFFKIYDTLRKQYKIKANEKDGIEDLDILNVLRSYDCGESLEDSEKQEIIKKKIQKLRYNQQKVLNLRFFQRNSRGEFGLSLKEVSKVLRISDTRVKQIQDGALDTLKKSFSESEKFSCISKFV